MMVQDGLYSHCQNLKKIMNKKILLIYPKPDKEKDCRFGYSLLLLYVGATLKKNGYNVKLFDFSNIEYSESTLIEKIKESTFVIMEVDAFSLKRSTNTYNAIKICELIKRVKANIPISVVGKEILLEKKSFKYADYTLIGDPEVNISKFLTIIETIPTTPQIINIGKLTNMDNLPFPDYGLLSNENFIVKPDINKKIAPSGLMETARGCPGCCTFCQRKGWNKNIISFKLNRISDNFIYLSKNGIKNIWIIDENFSGSLPRAKKILTKLSEINKSKIKICISSWTHIDEEFIFLCKKAGVSIISFGLESVDIRNQIFYKKPINFAKFQKYLDLMNSLGIYTVGNFIIGSPFDDTKTIKHTFDFILNSNLDEINFKTLDYMIGSELYDNLPEYKKNKIHIFASKENKLTILTKREISTIISNFLMIFKISRQKRLQEKILKFGPPYYEYE